MDSKKSLYFLEDQTGQSTVEYIMLMAVVIFIVTSVLRSSYFKQIFGEEGQFATVFRQEIEFGYRHAFSGRDYYSDPSYQQIRHPSYEKGGETRFFGASEKYPQ